jgi:hypothetical protein
MPSHNLVVNTRPVYDPVRAKAVLRIEHSLHDAEEAPCLDRTAI